MEEWVKAILIIVAGLAITPLLCMVAWNGFAWAFNLPTFSFWHWLIVVMAFKGLTFRRKDGE